MWHKLYEWAAMIIVAAVVIFAIIILGDAAFRVTDRPEKPRYYKEAFNGRVYTMRRGFWSDQVIDAESEK